MSDVGYSTNFEIYLTKNNGVQIVTNELSLSILREMRYHEVSPSDVAERLNLSKSTIQASLTKLYRNGILKQETRINDARSVIYRLAAEIIFCSDTDVEWQMYARMASTKKILSGGRCTSREDLSLYGVSITESGLNIVQGMFNIGAALTRGKRGRLFLEQMLSSMRDQCEKHDIAVDMVTKDGLELRFESLYADISDVPLIIVPMLGGIISHSYDLLGYNLSHDISLRVTNNGQSVYIKVDKFIGQDYVDEDYEYVPHTENYYRMEEPFAIYSINKESTLFTNPTMMEILSLLSNNDMSVNELEDQMSISKATIYASLMKLVEMKAVMVDKDSGSPKKYKLLADPIVYCTGVPEGHDNLGAIVESLQNGEIDYYSAVIAYAMEIIRCMGVHFDKMFMRSGANTAHAVMELTPDIEPEKMLQVACNMVSEPDDANIVTMIPLKVRVTMAPNTLWGKWPADFVEGFIHEGLKCLTGDNYKVIVDVVHSR